MPAFTVARTTSIAADPETVFDTVSDFATWQKWSPWLLADKNATVTLLGDPQRVGGGFSWDGQVVGAGEMVHTELHPPSPGNSEGKMYALLRFTRPWKSESKVDIELSKGNHDGRDVTHVRWIMNGRLPFFLFFAKRMMVSLISMDYDRGLRMLKELIETGNIASTTEVFGITQSPTLHIVGLTGTTTLDAIGPSMDATINAVKKQFSQAGIETNGQWVSLYDHMSLKTQTLTYTSGMVRPAESATPDAMASRSIPAFDAMHISHIGRYDHLGNAWYAAYQNLRAMKRKVNSKLSGVELYRNSPDDTPPEELRTDVYVPVK